ncbi:MAG: hypothetical protein JSU62_00365 [Gammaproteobacteria bacterium]|nr:MAG: hypothetical protein JSU62_00365 [Gammaproteobacteria bacterium]
MSLNTEELYDLIPSVYRQRDSALGEPLKALVAILAEQGGVMESDIRQLYDDWFIETCDEWVVPYIGDLLGVRGLREIDEETPFTRRALVANTLRYRRRKGTAAVLEQLAFDATGWRVGAVEFFERLVANQHLNHIRSQALRTPDLRDSGALELNGSAFDRSAHSVDVRRIASGRGRHNIPNIGLFLWRLQSFRVMRSQLTEGGAADRYHVHPLGIDAPMFNSPHTEVDKLERTEEHHVPIAVRARLLYDELEQRRQSLVDGSAPMYRYFDDRPESRAAQVFELFLDNEPVPPQRIMVCHLSGWQVPPDTRNYTRINADGSSTTVAMPVSAAVDPRLGRVSLAPAQAGRAVRLTSSYGFPGDLGGGPYDRQASIDSVFASADWQIGVSREIPPLGGEVVATLVEAVDAWNAQPPGTVGIVTLMDSSHYEETLTGASRILIPEGSQLLIVVGDWPQTAIPDGPPGALQRRPGDVDADNRRPYVRGNVDVEGTAPADSLTPGRLVINGLWLEGNLRVRNGHLGELSLQHGTIVPDGFRLRVPSGNERLRIEMRRSICGLVSIDSDIEALDISDCILQNDGTVIDATQTPATICTTTVMGRTRVLQLNASDSLFTRRVTVERRQQGCVRFCALPVDSQTPRRFRCQPDLALEEAGPTDSEQIRARLRPAFTSTQYSNPAYAQLGRGCATELKTGAEDGGEMGAYNFLKQPQRLDNLHAAINGYLRFGLEAGVLFEN